MVRIIICDDNLPFAEGLGRRISESLLHRDVRSAIRICTDAGDFKTAIEAETPNLVFMDLALEDGDDGYGLAEYIRRRRINCEIIFITNYPERMPEAFPYRPIGFISKPAGTEELQRALDRYFAFYHAREGAYIYTSRNQSLRIPLEDILYFESAGHTVKLCRRSSQEPLTQFCRLDDIAARLEGNGFVRVHKSFLVNLDAIERVDRTAMRALLAGGASLPVSRSCYHQLMERFINRRLR